RTSVAARRRPTRWPAAAARPKPQTAGVSTARSKKFRQGFCGSLGSRTSPTPHPPGQKKPPPPNPSPTRRATKTPKNQVRVAMPRKVPHEGGRDREGTLLETRDLVGDFCCFNSNLLWR